MSETTSPDLHTVYAQQYTIACTGIAQHYAAAGDLWHAIHAQTLGYVSAADFVLRAHRYTPQPYLTAIAEAIETLPTRAPDATTITLTLHHILKTIAGELPADTLDDFFDAIINPRDLALTDVPVTPEIHDKVINQWLNGLSPQAFIKNRRETQVAHLFQAQRYAEDNDMEAAALEMHHADVAAFEAWLIEHALDTGDDTLTRARIQWDFFVESLSHIAYLPADLVESVTIVRSRMAWPLGPDNARTFAEAIPQI